MTTTALPPWDGLITLPVPTSTPMRAWLRAWFDSKHPPMDQEIADALPDPLRLEAGLPIGLDGVLFTGDLSQAGEAIERRRRLSMRGSGALAAARRGIVSHGTGFGGTTPFFVAKDCSEAIALGVRPACVMTWREMHAAIVTTEGILSDVFGGPDDDMPVHGALLARYETTALIVVDRDIRVIRETDNSYVEIDGERRRWLCDMPPVVHAQPGEIAAMAEAQRWMRAHTTMTTATNESWAQGTDITTFARAPLEYRLYNL